MSWDSTFLVFYVCVGMKMTVSQKLECWVGQEARIRFLADLVLSSLERLLLLAVRCGLSTEDNLLGLG